MLFSIFFGATKLFSDSCRFMYSYKKYHREITLVFLKTYSVKSRFRIISSSNCVCVVNLYTMYTLISINKYQPGSKSYPLCSAYLDKMKQGKNLLF